MSGVLSLSYRDYDNEIGNVRYPVATLTAANFDAQSALHTALKNATADLVLGELAKEVLMNESIVSLDAASDPSAQRELKWLVSYYAADNVLRTLEIPCAKTAELDPNDRAHADIGDAGVVDAYVTAFEAVIKVNGVSTVTVKEITLVGRPL